MSEDRYIRVAGMLAEYIKAMRDAIETGEGWIRVDEDGGVECVKRDAAPTDPSRLGILLDRLLSGDEWALTFEAQPHILPIAAIASKRCHRRDLPDKVTGRGMNVSEALTSLAHAMDRLGYLSEDPRRTVETPEEAPKQTGPAIEELREQLRRWLLTTPFGEANTFTQGDGRVAYRIKGRFEHSPVIGYGDTEVEAEQQALHILCEHSYLKG